MPSSDGAAGLLATRLILVSKENAIFETEEFQSEQVLLVDRARDKTQTQFIDLLLQKDKMAFERLYDDYSAAIYGLTLKILKDEALAEDALQETFVRVWRKIQTYDPSKGRLFTWMLNIARNISIDVLRAQESRMASKTTSIHTHSFDTKGASTTTPIEHIGIREFVEGLPAEQKMVIDLIYYLGYTQAEVAEEFGIPLGTVKSRVRLAMNHLRAKMG